MDNGTTYDVRVYRTEVYKGAKVTTYKVRWKTAHRAVEGGVPQCGAGRQLPQCPAHRGPQGEAFSLSTGRPLSVGAR